MRETTPKAFRCVRCGVEEEALPWGMEDIQGATQWVYSIPVGWWSITTSEGMLLFCRDEAVAIKGGEVLERGRGGQDGL